MSLCCAGPLLLPSPVVVERLERSGLAGVVGDQHQLERTGLEARARPRVAHGLDPGRRSELDPGDPVLIEEPHYFGAERIFILGRHPNRIALAKDFGATDVVSERGEDAVEREALDPRDRLVDAGMSAPRLGVVPVGTGNDFAKAAGIPLDWEAATTLLARRIADGASPRRIDLGRMNDRWFANGAGIGLDAKVTHIARSYRWPIGDVVYLLALFRCIVDGVITPDMTITSDEMTRSGPTTLVNVSNGAWVGGMFYIAPMADNSDGKLELIVADPVSRFRTLGLLPRILAGTHIGEKEVSHVGVSGVVIEAAAPVPSHLDGEVMPPMTRFEIELLPAALDLL